MNFELNENQNQFFQEARRFAHDIDDKVAEYEIHQAFPRHEIKELGKRGWMGGVIPKKYGGSEFDYVSVASLIEGVSWSWYLLGTFIAASTASRGQAFLKYGTEDQIKKYLTPLLSGDSLGGNALTESRSGSDVAGMDTTVEKDGSDYILNGGKAFIDGVTTADWFLAFGTFDKSKGKNGICAFIVERNWEGVETVKFKDRYGFRSNDLGAVKFRNVRIPADNRIGEEGEGLRVAMAGSEMGRLAPSIGTVACMERCIDESVEFAKNRVVFGSPIGDYQMIKSKVAEMVITHEAARWLSYNFAWLKDHRQGGRARREAAIAKTFATDSLVKVATEACQIFGARSNLADSVVGRIYRDAKVLQIVDGTSEIQRLLVSDYAFNRRSDT